MASRREIHIIDEIRSARSIEDMEKTNYSILQYYGFSSVEYRLIPSYFQKRKISLQTYDELLNKAYVDRSFEYIDPVEIYARSNVLPIDWDELRFASLENIRFFAKIDQYVLSNRGMTIPIRGKANDKALMSVTTSLPQHRWEQCFRGLTIDLPAIALAFHEKIMGLSGLRRTQEQPSLSPQEKECLRLTCYGGQAKTIANTLEISENAVRLYMRNAKDKLECATSTQAVAKSVTLDMIE